MGQLQHGYQSPDLHPKGFGQMDSGGISHKEFCVTSILNETNADLYDYFATGQNGDVSFYVDEARKANGRVLELGCGTGRMLIPMAEAGISIVGVDNSPAMLHVAQRKINGLHQ